MGRTEDEEFNYGSEFDRYVPPPPKVYKLSSSIPENLTASFQNLLNKRINDNYKVRKRQNLNECFTILKFTIIFIIFITTCKIITLFFGIDDRVEQYNESSQETVRICFYLLFTFALIVQFAESFAIVFDILCLTFVFTSLEFVIIVWSILDNYHSKDEHWLIFLWLIGMVIFVVHLVILYKMKFKRPRNSRMPSAESSMKDKEMNSESDQLFVPEQDCPYSEFLKQTQYNSQQAGSYVDQQANYVQTTIDIPAISTISQVISNREEDASNVDSNLVKFANDEVEHERREQLCQELLRQCQMKIYHLEMSQCNNQLILDQQLENSKQRTDEDCNANCDENCDENCDRSNQTSELNSPTKLSSSSCSDETCKEASKVILNCMNLDEYKNYKCQE